MNSICGDFYVKIFWISISSFIQIFNYDFIIYTYFTHIAASNTVIDDVIN